MSDEKEFYVGYGPVPDKDKRFLLKAVPLGLVGLGVVGAVLGKTAPSAGGGRWETGTPVTLSGRIGFHPYPVLWVGGEGIVIAGIGKKSADPYIQPFDGRSVQVTGVKIVRDDCYMLGIADGDISEIGPDAPLDAIPDVQDLGDVQLIGEILDAQCFMGIMNPGYGRTHRGCATQCIRGGQPVYFSMGVNSKGRGGESGCGGVGYLLANPQGQKINHEVLGDIAVPVMLSARHRTIGNLNILTYTSGSLRRLS